MKTETIRKYYLPVESDNKTTDVKVELYYSIGGCNMFTYETERRGYYISAVPVERGIGYESFTAFSGWKRCLVECSRKSKSKQIEAEKEFEKWDEETIMRTFPDLIMIDAIPFN